MTNDLSLCHAPVTRLFPEPDSEEGWEACGLTDEQVAFYEENGYVAGVRVLTGGQLEALRAELSELMSPLDDERRGLWYEFHSNESRDPSRVLFHALGAWRLAPAFHDLLWNPRFTVPASQLLRGPVPFWHDQLFCKPAPHG